MRKWLERLRLWLIKKLGGYDRQQIITHRHYVVAGPPVRVKRVVAVTSVSHSQIYNSILGNHWEYALQQLARELAQRLIRDRVVTIESTEDVPYDNVILRASLMVIDGKDAALCYPTPEMEARL